MKQSVGKHMPALGIGGDLAFVDGNEAHFPLNRHRFNGTQEPARAGRHDLFLAGDQRDIGGALESADLVIDFARQQPQRKADHAAGMAAQAFDREMRLAGVGRAKHGGDRPGGGGRPQRLAKRSKGRAAGHDPDLGKARQRKRGATATQPAAPPKPVMNSRRRIASFTTCQPGKRFAWHSGRFK